MTENWKKIKGYDGDYLVSSLGRVKSLKRNKPKVLSRVKLDTGYYCVNLSKNNKVKRHYIHRLVAFHFVNNDEGNPEVNHIDGNKGNCCAQNLEWVTPSQNCIHAFDIGLKDTKGEHHSKLSEKDVLAIREEYEEGSTTQRQLAREYGVSYGNIHCIVNRKSWAHL